MIKKNSIESFNKYITKVQLHKNFFLFFSVVQWNLSQAMDSDMCQLVNKHWLNQGEGEEHAFYVQ